MLAERARHTGVRELVEWGTPIQERHLRDTLDGSVRLARDEDPSAPA